MQLARYQLAEVSNINVFTHHVGLWDAILGDNLTVFYHKPWTAPHPHDVHRVWLRVYQELGLLALLDFGGAPEREVVVRDHHLEDPPHLLLPRQVARVDQHERGVQEVSDAERVPWVDDTVVPEADLVARLQELWDAREPPSLWVVVETALEDDAVQGVRHDLHPRPSDGGDDLVGSRAVVGVEGGAVAGHDHPGHVPVLGKGADRLDVPRVRVVGLVAVDVDHQAVRLCRLEHQTERLCRLLARPLQVRDPPDRVEPEARGPEEPLLVRRRGQDPVLGEADDLNPREVLLGHRLLQRDERLDPGRTRGVRVRPHAGRPAGHHPLQGFPGPRQDVVGREGFLRHLPVRDPLDQRARVVRPLLAEEDGVQVQVRVRVRRSHQGALCVDGRRPVRRPFERPCWGHARDSATLPAN
mmetsp:Transcript_34637/g.83809  ORF Transcript_34637/g.83809 Transcript_34637/m.83809 type:complete len:413 (+) Transcript_34637:164-1402(+)